MSIKNIFVDCIEKNPNKIAVSYKDNSITFFELNNLVKKYCFQMTKKLDSRADFSPIGVICSRSIDPIIQFIAVIYTGNYYIPLDPESPKERIDLIIEDAKINIILGQEEHRDLINKLKFNGYFITNNDLTDEKYESNKWISDDNPLYMVYTSGSTGKPKGVLKSRKAEKSFIETYCNTFDFKEDDIIGNQTPFYFDAAAKDIYLMLYKGITMEIIPSELFMMPTDLIDYLNEKRITFISWVPTALSIVAQLNPFSYVKPKYLRKVFFVGEVMPMKHLNTWRNELCDLQYVNLYGQSELAGICCYYEVKKEFNNDESLPIGKALSNCKIYLLDSNDKIITSPNIVGEMYIVSDALAMEYYNDQEKTNNSFVYKNFGDDVVRCFKTGDLAQYDFDGNLVFASRSDYQIKHMGHRIELGEIETIAGSLEGINRCCCLYNSDKKKIVLFVELTNGYIINNAEIKSKLKTKLSSYMVPNKVEIIESLPLNANGKIDRQKLKILL